jgi:uncharacterized protein
MQEIMTAAGPAYVVLEQPGRRKPRFLLVLTHGAGGTPDTADVLAVAAGARLLGAVTALVTQPYRVRGGRAPGSVVKQDAAWLELVAALRNETTSGGKPLPLVQCGRSNGARVACRTAVEAAAVGVVALAFPLHPPGQPEKTRDAELRRASAGSGQGGAAAGQGAGKRAAPARVLVVNGDRDPFGVPEPDELTRVVVLAGEAHALSKNPSAVAEAVTDWLKSPEGPRPRSARRHS